MNSLIIVLSDINIDLNADDESEWVINEDIAFEYILSGSNDTFEIEDVIVKKLNKIIALHIPVCSNARNQHIKD